MTRGTAGVALAIFAAIAGSSASARAQVANSGQDVATAQALFDEGKRLMEAKSYAEACPKLVESQRLDPGGGTLFAIALCHESEGKSATAWADYNVALAEARRTGRRDREEAAAAKEKELGAKLTRMRIVVTAPVAGLALMRDGAPVGNAQWGVALPIDPGEHAFSAKAPGKLDWQTSVDMRGEGKTVDVVVPALNDAPKTVTSEVPVLRPAEPAPQGGTDIQKTAAVVVGAAGLVGLGVGGYFGARAISKWIDVETACPNKVCTDPAKVTLGDDAGAAADLATVLVSLGAGALVAGIVLWITAPRSDHRGLYISPGAARSSMGFTFGGAL